MKARTESGENHQPKTPTKLCRGCFEVPIPIDTALCDKCAHIQKLQNFVNSIQMLRVTGNAYEDGLQLRAVIDSAKPLVRE